MPETHERWTPAGAIDWPCPSVAVATPGSQLVLRLEFSALTSGPTRDLVLALDWGRVVMFATWQELSHPLTGRESLPALPMLSGAEWAGYAFPLLRVRDSELIAGLDGAVRLTYGDHLCHYRIVSLDHTLDLLATGEPSATWLPTGA